jgi:hypothetical protein
VSWPCAAKALVDRVLVERPELLEPGVHRAGARIQSRVMLARGFGEFLRVRRELVPDPVEVDALAALYQAFLIRPPEGEVPEGVAPGDLLPGPDAWERRVDDDEPLDPPGVLRGERVAHHVADVVGDQINRPEFQCVEHAGDVVALRLLVVAAGGPGREAHPAEVGHDDRVVRRQLRGERRPHVAGLAVAMEQHDRGTAAADPHVEGRSVGRDLPDAEARRERLHLRRGGGHGERARAGEHRPAGTEDA